MVPLPVLCQPKSGESALEVGDDVLDVLDADGEADRGAGHTGPRQACIIGLRVGGGGGVREPSVLCHSRS